MKWSYRIITVAGTEVKIHATFALLLAFVAWEASSSGRTAVIEAVLLVCSMFLCVLLHEFGHVFAARRYGIQTPDITLLPIGGVARLERMPRKPSEELVVALCGPLVNVVIAAVLALFFGIPSETELMDSLKRFQGFAWTLMGWNLMMVVFNMIPAFPMDGGRVLRALLAMFTGDYAKATRWAAGLGQMIAVVAAVVIVTNGWFTKQPFLLLIAFFVFIAAGREAQMVSEEAASNGLTVEDAMMTDFRHLSREATLLDAVYLLRTGSQHDFPVLDEAGQVVGLLTRSDLISQLASNGAQVAVGSAMVSGPQVVSPAVDMKEAIKILRDSGVPALPVVEPYTGRLVGLFTLENAGEVILVRSAMAGRPIA